MSLISLDPIRRSHPDLSAVTDSISTWLTDHPYRSFLDSRAVLREFGSEYTADQIVEFLAALKESGIVRVYFRVVDDRGSFTPKKYDSFVDVPDVEEDPNGVVFAVSRNNIVQVYEFVE